MQQAVGLLLLILVILLMSCYSFQIASSDLFFEMNDGQLEVMEESTGYYPPTTAPNLHRPPLRGNE